jgi:hypothetical protein
MAIMRLGRLYPPISRETCRAHRRAHWPIRQNPSGRAEYLPRLGRNGQSGHRLGVINI